MRPSLATAAKVALSASVIGYLVWDVSTTDPDALQRIAAGDFRGLPLAAAGLAYLAAFVLGWTRWHLLCRALDLPCRWRDNVRLGALGCMLDFAAVGTLGGDVARGLMLGRETERYGDALASIVADRLLGLYILASVATVAVVTTDLEQTSATVATIAQVTLLVWVALSVGVVGLFALTGHRERVAPFIERVPALGPLGVRALVTAARFSERRSRLLPIATLAAVVPCLNIFGFYLVAQALLEQAPNLAQHFRIIPTAMLSGTIPLPMEALGVFDYVLSELYQLIGAGGPGDGFVVALGYRTLTVGVVMAGALYFAVARSRVRAALAEADSEQAAA